jgi:hypothetical protein
MLKVNNEFPLVLFSFIWYIFWSLFIIQAWNSMDESISVTNLVRLSMCVCQHHLSNGKRCPILQI